MTLSISNSNKYDISKIYDTIGDALLVFDWKFNIQCINSSFSNFFHSSPEKLVNKNIFDIEPGFKKLFFYEAMNAIISSKKNQTHILTDGKKYFNVRTFVEQNDFSIYIQEISKPITQEKIVSTNDQLTSLPNRTAFEEDISQMYNFKTSFALTLIDVNKFRLLNDSMGIDAGNICLMEIASRLKGNIKNKVYRVGPNQFAILIPDSKSIALDITQKVINLFKKPFDFNKEEYYISVSAGFNYIDEYIIDISDVISNTEFVLAKAKKFKNSYLEYSKDTQRNNISMILARDLKNSLNTPQLVNYYQPQVDTKTGKICGAEALIRWNHYSRGVVMPSDFLYIAQEHDLMQEVDRHVFISTLRDIIDFKSKYGFQIPISLNFSTSTICNLDTITFVDRGFQKSKIDPSLITIEITENAIMDDISKSQKVLQELHKIGVNIAIDDFGTGYSSMCYLVRYPTDYIKIDKEFITDINNNVLLQKMTSNIIKLGKSLGMKVVAEGVETKEEFAILKEYECDIIQGYLFSKAVNKETFIQFSQKVGVINKP